MPCAFFKLPLFFFLLPCSVSRCLVGFFICFVFCFSFSGQRCLFSRHDFYFSNKFRWLLFFCGYLSLFVFNCASFINKGIWVNLFKLIFSFLHFFTPNKTKMRKIKIFYILSLFHSPTIFYSPTFPPHQPNGLLMGKNLRKTR